MTPVEVAVPEEAPGSVPTEPPGGSNVCPFFSQVLPGSGLGAEEPSCCQPIHL